VSGEGWVAGFKHILGACGPGLQQAGRRQWSCLGCAAAHASRRSEREDGARAERKGSRLPRQLDVFPPSFSRAGPKQTSEYWGGPGPIPKIIHVGGRKICYAQGPRPGCPGRGAMPLVLSTKI
jgi:hypothetical protein